MSPPSKSWRCRRIGVLIGCRLAAVGREEVECAVWPVLVVVAVVDVEDVFEVAAAEDQDPVEVVGADGAVGVGGVTP